jgi:hypothetical protein
MPTKRTDQQVLSETNAIIRELRTYRDAHEPEFQATMDALGDTIATLGAGTTGANPMLLMVQKSLAYLLSQVVLIGYLYGKYGVVASGKEDESK